MEDWHDKKLDFSCDIIGSTQRRPEKEIEERKSLNNPSKEYVPLAKEFKPEFNSVIFFHCDNCDV